mmetsp:Transcript_1990/g.2797  ORF Transcript_1990/g.2797 Transcript_1990/m.2797 type:complete len:726 (+) Transcript_1990:149-2326(+)|eukprot:CAMPEP_0178914502 /NCGR_PEP_ID=MMETSP0786-20121207/11463_1 /TAXON_ID=186022 /ORGANISM="Thalassionema frauenfeldii, Strain CCMP 1798" /LENGTH=725 /DNA_ID=CAMNT_0020587421 /DNA_START=84 /DNA_END=2261 /DNA_ORIENTATION=+
MMFISSCYNAVQIIQLLLLTVSVVSSGTTAASNHNNNILVVGSANADTFLPVPRMPVEGENLMTSGPPQIDLPGGKGCTQAVAASKLLLLSTGKVKFVGQFGSDANIFQDALKHVDCSHCGHHQHLTSGRGYVFLTDDGSVSAVVSGGSNMEGWSQWEQMYYNNNNKANEEQVDTTSYFDSLLEGVYCVMLQREVPEFVNLLVAAEAKNRGILVLQDVGGDDRPISENMLQLCDYIMPNESELNRLVASFENSEFSQKDADSSLTDDNEVITRAKFLQSKGARNVLVSRGKRGCLLLTEQGKIVQAAGCSVSDVVDETGAGDCFRAAFAASLREKSMEDCLVYANAAGACAVTKKGAVPSTPDAAQVEELYGSSRKTSSHSNKNAFIPRGGGESSNKKKDNDKFPFLIGSRLNSMKDRPELWNSPLKTPKEFLKRQATVPGVTCVDFNYPQHFQGYWDIGEVKQALSETGLVAGAVCLRYPNEFARGAMNHPDATLRRKAIDLTLEAAKVAQELGCQEVVVWSAYDGYDYPFQVDYDEKWSQVVDAFRECCDTFPEMKFSVEFKPTDENTRFFTVPSTGAALLLVKEVDRPNFGLTLDVGHMLMAGENPGQSIAMAGKHVFGVQLNDGYTRLAAEDGLMFGSIHPSMALEIMYQLRRIGFSGHFYFDTFPQRTDPVQEATYNAQQVKKFWYAAGQMDQKELQKVVSEHDAIGALKLVEKAMQLFQ